MSKQRALELCDEAVHHANPLNVNRELRWSVSALAEAIRELANASPDDVGWVTETKPEPRRFYLAKGPAEMNWLVSTAPFISVPDGVETLEVVEVVK